ncbi:MAG: hypothetical protein RL104_971 [Bacteroidota bacterium]
MKITYPKSLIAAAALAFTAFSASAQQRYLDEVFTDAQVTVLPNVAYGYNFSQYVPATMGGPMVVPMYADIYMPDTAVDQVASRPVVIIFHTGSFLPKGLASPMGDRKDSAVVEMAKRFARRGFVAVSASYRLGWLANSTNLDLRRGTNLMAVYNAVQDAKVCVRSVRASKLALGDPYRVDPSAISLIGAGSGGYITLAYATIDNYAEVASPSTTQKWRLRPSSSTKRPELASSATPSQPAIPTWTRRGWATGTATAARPSSAELTRLRGFRSWTKRSPAETSSCTRAFPTT